MSHLSTPFEDSYQKLNPEQKKAVDGIEGPVMVVAGPGTGKTQILTLRIAHILLKTQTSPSSILALTFTQAAAINMRDRLSKIIGSEAHMVNIFTFHAFCSHVIEQNPDDFWPLLGMKLANDVQKAQLLEEVIDSNAYSVIKPFGKPYHYLPNALRSISDLKREGVSSKELSSMVDQERIEFENIPDKESSRIPGKLKGVFQNKLRNIEKNAELAHLYAQYQLLLHKHNLYDYDDLIMSVLEKLRDDEDFRLRQMEQYQYILVDEHQDSNNAQNKIIQLLTTFHPNPNIFVVGDEKQAIFRFQGASVENFRRFTLLYPEAQLITLTQNYRSTQTILDSAIGFLGLPNQKLFAQKKHTDIPIQVIPLETPQQEEHELICHIQDDIDKGINLDEIAILVRTRAQVQSLARVLHTAHIPVFVDYDEDVFESEVVKRLIILLQAVRYYAEDEYLFPVFHLDFLGFHPLDLYRLSQIAKRDRKQLSELFDSKQKLHEYGVKDAEALHSFFTNLGKWYIFSKNNPLHSLIHTVVQESGLLDSILTNTNPILSVAPLRELYDIVQALDQDNLWTLEDFFTYLEKIKQHNIRIKVKVKIHGKGKVQIMTVHSAKGLEFDHVYIPFSQDTVWGKKGKANMFTLPQAVYNSDDEGDDTEEKRLFFVALTRARKKVILSYSKTALDGTQVLPSPYISEIRDELKEVVHVSAHEMHVTDGGSTDAKEIDEFRSFVQASFEQYGLSVSALNNYMECPWKYFYVNLVRVPSGKDKILMFGNAIHNAITYFYRHFKETGEKSLDYLLKAYEKAVYQEYFSKGELGDSLVRGKDILMHYFTRYENELSQNVQIKYRIPEVILRKDEVCGYDIRLTGELDLVQYVDSSLSNVWVIDFKTGKPKSRKDIMGETKTSKGNYYRQLVFYKLLLRLHKPRWNMQQGVIDFIQEDDKGVFHREAFDISDEEVDSLIQHIQKASQEILTLDFWNRHCDNTECEWCLLRKSLEPRFNVVT